jgi:Double zinc ribbon
MGAVAVFGIENDGLNVAVNLLILVLAVIWFALVYWTFADARRRIGDTMLVWSATAASFFFPFVGTIVYVIVRPPEYLADVRERELEIAAAEARLATLEHAHCPYCGFEVDKDFLRCPSCLRRLKEPCVVCSKPLDPRWKLCPYCEAEVGQAPPEPRPRRTRRTAAASGSGSGSQRSGSGSSQRSSRQADGERQITAERTARSASRERPPSSAS